MNRPASALLAAVLVAALVPGSGFAAAAVNEHGTNAFTWVEDDFCGTGVTVEHAYTETFTVHFAPNAFRVTSTNRDVLTNLRTGDAIVGSAAGVLTGAFSGGDPAGIRVGRSLNLYKDLCENHRLG